MKKENPKVIISPLVLKGMGSIDLIKEGVVTRDQANGIKRINEKDFADKLSKVIRKRNKK